MYKKTERNATVMPNIGSATFFDRVPALVLIIGTSASPFIFIMIVTYLDDPFTPEVFIAPLLDITHTLDGSDTIVGN